MRALVLDAFGAMSVHEVNRPTPGVGQVLVKVAVTGICGSDIHGFAGTNRRRWPGQIMGHESSGFIAALGPGTDDEEMEVGDPVTFNPVVVPADLIELFAGREQHASEKLVIGVNPEWPAAFADYVVVPARNVVRLRHGVPIENGALAEPLAVALHAVARAGVRPADNVLVIGGGPIGQSIVVALRMRGVAAVAATEIAPARRDLLARLGAAVIGSAGPPLAEAVRDHFGSGADVTIDAVGVTSTIADGLEATRLGGTLCLVGMGSPEIALDAYRVSTDERTIVGSFTYSADEFREAVRLLGQSPVDLATLISRVVEVEDAPAAFIELAAQNSVAGKVLVRFS